jgi:hypothetical protein
MTAVQQDATVKKSGWVVVGALVVGFYALDNHRQANRPTYRPSYTPLYTPSPAPSYTPSYTPSIDIDCADIGEPVYVGSSDPYFLDEDGDGWGCESYGVGGSDYYEDPYYEDPYYEDPYYDDGSGGDPFYEYP